MFWESVHMAMKRVHASLKTIDVFYPQKNKEEKWERNSKKETDKKRRRKKAIMRPAHVGRAWAICPLYGAISVCPFGVATCPSAFKKSCGAKSGLISYHLPRPQEYMRVSTAATIYHECVRQMAAGVDRGWIRVIFSTVVQQILSWRGWQQFLFESYAGCTIKIASVKKKHSTVPE